MTSRRSRVVTALSMSVLALACSSCRDRATPKADAAPTASEAPPASPAPPRPFRAVHDFASASGGIGVRFADGRVVATTQAGTRSANTTGQVASFRSDDGVAYAWLERGRPMVWLAEKGAAPTPVCEVPSARDIVLQMNRVCLILGDGALGCTDAIMPECGAFTTLTAKGPFERFLVARSGGFVVLGTHTNVFEVSFPNDRPRVSPLAGKPRASEYIGIEQQWTKTSDGTFVPRASARCLFAEGAFTCFDKKSGKSHLLRELPVEATAPGLLAKNTLCFMLEGDLTCRALATGVEGEASAFPGHALEKLPPLPAGHYAARWGEFGDGVAVLTTAHEVFTWQLDIRGTPPSGWSRVELR